MTTSPSSFAPVSGLTSYTPFSPKGKESTSVAESIFLNSLFSLRISSLSTKLTETSLSPSNFSSRKTAMHARRISIRSPVGIRTFFCLSVMITFTLSIAIAIINMIIPTLSTAHRYDEIMLRLNTEQCRITDGRHYRQIHNPTISFVNASLLPLLYIMLIQPTAVCCFCCAPAPFHTLG